MSFSDIKKIDLIIVLNDLTAEGCPILALDLIDESLKKGLKPLVVRFFNNNDELLNEFTKRGIKVISLNLKRSGLIRYFKIIFQTNVICRTYRPNSLLSFPF